MVSTRRALVALGLPALVLCGGGARASSQSALDARADAASLAAVPEVESAPLCDAPTQPGFLRCMARRVTTPAAVTAGGLPQGYGPADLAAAYAIPASASAKGQIVAIVDAYDAPNAESDLAVYRSTFGLPPLASCAGTPTNGGAPCFLKVSQRGDTTTLPTPDAGWAGEIALDVQMVSAVCPDCTILLVEADDPSAQNLAAGVDVAAKLGAVAISNSYGGPEDNTVSQQESDYNHPGVLVTASSGDSSFSAGASYPASSQHVLAVGGTSLTKSASARGWAEKAWSKAGSGCSGFIGMPAFQTALGLTDCSKRGVADVAAVADPATGVAVYVSSAATAWGVYGGTSASSPIVAALFTRLGLATTMTNAYPYAHKTSFNDVTTGTNGTCGGSELCTAKAGWDGPTGMGTPNAALLAGPGAGSGSSSGGGSGGGSGSSSGGGSGSAAGSSSGGSSGSTSGSSSGGAGSTSGNVPSDGYAPTHDAGAPGASASNGAAPRASRPSALDSAQGPACSYAPAGSSHDGFAALALGAAAILASRRRRRL